MKTHSSLAPWILFIAFAFTALTELCAQPAPSPGAPPVGFAPPPSLPAQPQPAAPPARPPNHISRALGGLTDEQLADFLDGREEFTNRETPAG